VVTLDQVSSLPFGMVFCESVFLENLPSHDAFLSLLSIAFPPPELSIVERDYASLGPAREVFFSIFVILSPPPSHAFTTRPARAVLVLDGFKSDLEAALYFLNFPPCLHRKQ